MFVLKIDLIGSVPQVLQGSYKSLQIQNLSKITWEFFWPKLRKCRMKSSYRRRRRLVSPRIQKEKRKKKKLPISHLSPSCWKTSLLLPSLANRFSRCRWGNSLVKVVTCRRALTKNQKGKIGILYSWLGEINRPQFKREPYALVAKCFNLFWFFWVSLKM